MFIRHTSKICRISLARVTKEIIFGLRYPVAAKNGIHGRRR